MKRNKDFWKTGTHDLSLLNNKDSDKMTELSKVSISFLALKNLPLCQSSVEFQALSALPPYRNKVITT